MSTPSDDPVAAIDGIRVGIGGWTYAPWRGPFYPPGLVQRRELEFASRRLSTIEINGTYYRAQKPATYARWRDETPPGFVFSAKAPMRITKARDLTGTGAAVEDFVGGIATLGDRLGPLVWQFEPGRALRHDELAAFLTLLPAECDGRRIRHALDVRHRASVDEGLVSLARRHGVATIFNESDLHPSFADATADFIYARLMHARTGLASGYPPQELRQWAQRARTWAGGGEPDDLPRVADATQDVGATATPAGAREVFVYFINAAKERNPAAAMALLEALGAR
ncbi:MAG: DUF72 domain-containing protein [Pseudomonadota bacterium]|nr:DUF72 domain-containing protein [Pseudomonadota bacterium]